MASDKDKDILALIILFAFVLIIVANNYLWLKIDRSPFTYDAHRHFMFSLRVWKEYQHFSLATPSNIIQLTERHPPLVGMVTAPFYFLFGLSQDTGTMLNSTIFISILLISVYGIGKILKGRKAGLLAAFITAMYPIVFNHMKTYNLDLPLTAMVALSMLLLLLSRNFTKLGYSLLFGLSCGLGFLTKDSFPLYIIAPFIATIVFGITHSISCCGYRDNNQKNIWLKKAWRNTLLLIAIAFLVSITYSIYYYKIVLVKLMPGKYQTYLVPGELPYQAPPYYKIVLGKLTFGEYRTFYPPPGELPNLPAPFLFLFKRLKSILWYLWGFINWQAGFFFSSIFIIILFYFKRTKFRGKGILLSTLFGFILVAFSKGAYGEHMTWLGVRFTLPVLPFVAIISSIGIMAIPIEKLKKTILTMILVTGTAQWLIISYGTKLLPEEVSIPIHSKLPSFIQKYYLFPEKLLLFKQIMPAYGGPLSRPNQEIPEKITIPQEIYRVIDSSAQGKEVNIVVIPDISRIWACLQYNTFMNNRPYRIFGDWTYFDFLRRPQGGRKFINNVSWNEENILPEADYVIDKEEGEIGEFWLLKRVQGLHHKFHTDYKDNFELLRQIRWPDGYNVFIYKKKY